MYRLIGFVLLAVHTLSPNALACTDSPSHDEVVVKAISIEELDSKHDGKEVTIKFTVARLQGVAQRQVDGQAPSFVIETDFGAQDNQLSVWIEGELANVLERLDMGFGQQHELRKGTTIVATGLVSIQAMDAHQFLISITRWQNFRILPSPK